MNGLDEMEVNFDKAKRLLEYLIEKSYVIDETRKHYETMQIENYYLKEIYQDTSLFLDVIMDYMIYIQGSIETYREKNHII